MLERPDIDRVMRGVVPPEKPAARRHLGVAAAVSEPTPGLDERALRAGSTPDKPVNAED